MLILAAATTKGRPNGVSFIGSVILAASRGGSSVFRCPVGVGFLRRYGALIGAVTSGLGRVVSVIKARLVGAIVAGKGRGCRARVRAD